MVQRGQGSTLIVVLHPLYKESSCRVSKTGLLAYSEVLAIELAPYRVWVNTIIPGLFVTCITEAFFSGEKSETLRKSSYMNARLTADAIELLRVNIGMAVDTELVLLVPVIRNADQKSLRQFGVEFRELVDGAPAARFLQSIKELIEEPALWISI